MSVHELELLVVSGRYREAGRLFLQLMIDDSLSKSDLGKACYLEAIAKSKSGEAYSAVQLSELAEQHAIACGDSLLLGKVWANGIEYYRQVSDYHRAEETAEKWLANQGMYPDLVQWIGQVHLNLALLHQSRKQVEFVWRHLDIAVRSFQQELSQQPEKRRSVFQRLLVHCLKMYAWTLYQHNRISEGDVKRELAEQYLSEDDTEGQRDQILLLALRALRAYMEKDYSQVGIICQDLIRDTTTSCNSTDFWVHWLLGMSAANQGLGQIAREMGEACLDLAARLNQPYLMNQGILLRQAAHQLGGTHEAG